MEKYFCALELHCNLTPAELICHLLFYARAYLRKDNSCKNWSKGIIFTVFKRRQKAYCDKLRDLGKVINRWNDDLLNLIQKIQHTFHAKLRQNVMDGKVLCMVILQNLVRTTNPENFSSIGQILLKISFLNGKNNSFWEWQQKLSK